MLLVALCGRSHHFGLRAPHDIAETNSYCASWTVLARGHVR